MRSIVKSRALIIECCCWHATRVCLLLFLVIALTSLFCSSAICITGNPSSSDYHTSSSSQLTKIFHLLLNSTFASRAITSSSDSHFHLPNLSLWSSFGRKCLPFMATLSCIFKLIAFFWLQAVLSSFTCNLERRAELSVLDFLSCDSAVQLRI